MNLIKDQASFMKQGGQDTEKHNKFQSSLYQELIDEEYEELMEAIACEPVENHIKEALDLIVVSLGFILSHGIDAELAWKLVHDNNMQKVKTPEKDAKGKIQKSHDSKQCKTRMIADLKSLCEGGRIIVNGKCSCGCSTLINYHSRNIVKCNDCGFKHPLKNYLNIQHQR